jgi:2-hydroxy-3-keto-5-methylthiopentenyl-1-phosphate phosphatase
MAQFNSAKAQMTDIIIYSDYDGTLTQRAGNDTVFSPFYQSLLEGYKPGVQQDYKTSPLKSEQEVKQLFIEKFGPYDKYFDYSKPDANMLITPEAVTFLHQVLENDNIHVRIVTKNRKDYIQAMLHYQGFTSEEIFKLEIFDSGLKFQSVNQDLLTQLWPKEQSEVFVLDDSKADLEQMLFAVKWYGFQAEQIHQYNLMPGQFAWLDYLNTIQNSLSSAQGSTAQTTATPALSEENAPDPIAEERIPTLPVPEQSSTLSTLSYSTMGFSLGFVIGALLVGTGIFAPVGTGVLGALTLGLTIATLTGALSGAVGHSLSQTASVSVVEPNTPPVTSSFSHHAALQQSNAAAQAPVLPVEHYESPLAKPERISETDEQLSPPLRLRTSG